VLKVKGNAECIVDGCKRDDAMLQIRSEQMQALDAASMGDLQNRVLEYLRSDPAFQGHSEVSLRQQVMTAFLRARQWGISTERALAQFAIIALCTLPDFDQLPQVQHLFRLPGLSMDEKLYLLSDYVIDRSKEKGQK